MGYKNIKLRIYWNILEESYCVFTNSELMLITLLSLYNCPCIIIILLLIMMKRMMKNMMLGGVDLHHQDLSL